MMGRSHPTAVERENLEKSLDLSRLQSQKTDKLMEKRKNEKMLPDPSCGILQKEKKRIKVKRSSRNLSDHVSYSNVRNRFCVVHSK